ncbi:P-loop containing nucleoside triphosphate hydrolase protein [Peziza echinospora]|nr:P-loop containing nucleoside triphosphate hydrolase protein [Peziza echinospora]
MRLFALGQSPALCRCLTKASPASRLRLLAPRPLLAPRRRRYATQPPEPVLDAPPSDLPHTRNIGIIAHIDAGKTTTTERMLYYSGFTRRIGDVDEGSTVMDYLPAERARGITITSACITFPWHSHTINLIDTPGHADFTFEVERAIRVLDGAVTILDGVAGVEAQTEKVWRQADAYGIPRIVFVNKLDRMGAGFGRTVREIGLKLGGWPAVLQLPMYETDSSSEEVLTGLVDVVSKRVFRWSNGGDGRSVAVHDYKWLEAHRPNLYEEALKARVALVELLSEFDEEIVELYLAVDDHQLVPPADIKRSLRKLTLDGTGRVVPVLCGASFRNMGVQPLLDAVVDYLPSPADRPPAAVSYYNGRERALLAPDDGRMCALAFKVVHDPKRGPMVYVRVYSGTLNRAAHLLNTSLQVREKAQRLLRMYADEAVDIPAIPTGHIGVILGLKHARTGDTLVEEPPAAKHHHHHHKDPVPAAREATLQLRPIAVPPPVFFASIEPASIAEQKPLEEALALLLREDPSLHVSIDEDSGQTLLSGMGELHLEIARDRLVKDLKAKAEMGHIVIGYRETVTGPLGAQVHKLYDREVGGKRVCAGIAASVGSREFFNNDFAEHNTSIIETIPLDSENILTVTILQKKSAAAATPLHNPAAAQHLQAPTLPCPPGQEELHLPPHLLPYDPTLRNSLLSGAIAALSRGPALGFPCHSTHVHLVLDPNTDIPGGSTESTPPAFASATRLSVVAALKAAVEAQTSALMEPLMDVAISIPESELGHVVGDISGARGGNVYSLDDDPSDSSAPVGMKLKIDQRKIYAPPDYNSSDRGGGGDGDGDGSGTGQRPRTVRAKVPLKEMVGYLRHLRSLTKGRGSFVMGVDRFERMAAQRARSVFADMGAGKGVV